MAPRILGKKETKGKKDLQLKFVIDCTLPVDDNVLALKDFREFLNKYIKVNGKPGDLKEDVVVAEENKSIVVSSKIPFSKRYLKSLTKRYLKRQTLRNYLYVTARDKASYQLKYFNIQQDNAEEN